MSCNTRLFSCRPSIATHVIVCCIQHVVGCPVESETIYAECLVVELLHLAGPPSGKALCDGSFASPLAMHPCNSKRYAPTVCSGAAALKGIGNQVVHV